MAPVAAVVAAIDVRLGEGVPAGAPLIRLAPSPATAASYTQAKSALAVAGIWSRARASSHDGISRPRSNWPMPRNPSPMRAPLCRRWRRWERAAARHSGPVPGRRDRSSGDPGAIVAQGTALLDLAAPQSLVLNVGVMPAQAAAIHANESAAVQVIGGDRPMASKVLLCGAMAEADTGLVPVEIALPPGGLLPGEMAQAAITTSEEPGLRGAA